MHSHDQAASSPFLVERSAGDNGDCIRAARLICAGEIVFDIEGTIVHEPSRYTIQLDADRHILPVQELWGLVNHGCYPNIHIDIEKRKMFAIADIPAGADLRFNYNTTEWKLASPFSCGCTYPGCVDSASPFTCACTFPGCVRWIRGFTYLNAAQREAIRPWLSPLLKSRLGRFD